MSNYMSRHCDECDTPITPPYVFCLAHEPPPPLPAMSGRFPRCEGPRRNRNGILHGGKRP